jgi:putative flippase GtrA
MKRLITRYLFPRKENDYQPHLLQRKAMFVLFAVVLGIQSLLLVHVSLVSRSPYFASILESVLIESTNVKRTENSRSALVRSSILEKAAQRKANDMAERGYFSHTTPEGKTPWQWFSEGGYAFLFAGENLAVDFVDSTDVMYAWMQSLSHRKNILNNQFTEVGIGIAQGTYKNRSAIFIVQFFGRPNLSASAKTSFTSSSPFSASTLDVFVSEISPPSPIAINESSVVLGEEAGNIFEDVSNTKTSMLKWLLTRPHILTTYLYFILAMLVSFVLIFKLTFNMKRQHTPLIVNGLAILTVIVLILLLNQYILVSSGAIS